MFWLAGVCESVEALSVVLRFVERALRVEVYARSYDFTLYILFSTYYKLT